jgi:hypothetical protein
MLSAVSPPMLIVYEAVQAPVLVWALLVADLLILEGKHFAATSSVSSVRTVFVYLVKLICDFTSSRQ